MSISKELKEFLLSEGASDVGFFSCEDGAMKYGVSVVVRLSPAIIAEIGDEPTHTYFNHYRAVNAFIDRLLLQAGLFLQRKGYSYITVTASQSINKDGWNYSGRYSHKKGACLSGLGAIGRNSLFIHKDFGSMVRLGTLFTDCPLETGKELDYSLCDGCDICVSACPAGAISGREFSPGTQREEMFDPEKCSEYMKKQFQKIGRGAVCGICMRVCPLNKLPERKM
ncbi:MAG: epoxyqueuosine reductase [Clostridia bacterium]|nr:epoxyqueuosine reductase [Clostridia bacterium]